MNNEEWKNDATGTATKLFDLYNVRVSQEFATVIEQLAITRYGKDIAITIRTPEVRNMIDLYAIATGQKK
jgi:hypothetical protein